MFTRADQEFSIYLLTDTLDEVGSAGVVYRYHDYAAQCAAEKHRHPLRRIWSPQQDAVAFSNSTLFQVTGKLECSFGYLSIAPAHAAVTATLNVGTRLALLQKVVQVVENRAATHAYDGIPLSAPATAKSRQPMIRTGGDAGCHVGPKQTYGERFSGRSLITDSGTRREMVAWVDYAAWRHTTGAGIREL